MNESSRKSNSVICVAISLVLCLISLFLADNWPHHYLLKSVSLVLIVSVLYSLICWVQTYLFNQKIVEDKNYEALDQKVKSTDIFCESSNVRPAHAAYQSFVNIAVPVCSIIIGLSVIFVSVSHYRSLTEIDWLGHGNELFSFIGISFFLFLFCLLSGSFLNGLSTLPDNRWLRSAASWILFGAALFFMAIIHGGVSYLGFPQGESAVALFIVVVNFILGFELIVNVIIERYRPRTQNGIIRPVHESRLLTFFTSPGGILGNISNTIDYQFGVRLSETVLRQALTRYLIPYTLFVTMCLYLFDCIVIVDVDELAIKERLGEPLVQSPLQPGIHFKFPRPVDHILKVPVNKVHKVIVGAGTESHDDRKNHHHIDRIIVWNKAHSESEEIFLTAGREKTFDPSYQSSTLTNLPVNILSATIPVFYSIDKTRVADYIYHYRDIKFIVKKLAYEELVTYLASIDFIELMSADRQQAMTELEARIKHAVTTYKPSLGIEVQFVGLMEIHPPVEIAEAFQQVAAAREMNNAQILLAETDAATVVNNAHIYGINLISDAESHLYRASQLAIGDAERFKGQRHQFQNSPSLYKLRSFLNLLETETDNVKKYVIATNSKEVFVLDDQQKLRPDLLENLDFEDEKRIE